MGKGGSCKRKDGSSHGREDSLVLQEESHRVAAGKTVHTSKGYPSNVGIAQSKNTIPSNGTVGQHRFLVLVLKVAAANRGTVVSAHSEEAAHLVHEA